MHCKDTSLRFFRNAAQAAHRFLPLIDDVTGIILVGGKSQRMGKDKTFLKVEGTPIFERLLKAFSQVFTNILLVGDREERFSGYGLTVLPDIHTGSALGGLYSALTLADTEYIFVSSCDLPFPHPGIIRYLCSLRQGQDAVVPTMAHGYEPLFAAYSKRCLQAMHNVLQKGECCVYAFYPEIRLREVRPEELFHFDPLFKSFINVNTPDELAEIGGEL